MISTKLLRILLALAVSLFVVSLFPAKTFAAFNKNLLIDDFVFSRETAMSSSQIDNFLNTFNRSCISPNSGFSARIPSGYSPSGGFTYGSYVSAGQVIATAAQVYGVNPQVLIVTLEKEQNLVTGRNSTSYCSPANDNNHKYAAAVGYGCPDSGSSYSYKGLDLYRRNGTTQKNAGPTCVNSAQKAGFSQQVIRGAWLLKFGQQRSLGNVNWAVVEGSWDNSDDPLSGYAGPMTEGSKKRCQSCSTKYYDGYITIDGVSTHMGTGATAALYWYTPHFHGNELFVSLFESWFGSVRSNPIKVSIIDRTSSESGGHATVQYSLVSQPTANVTIPISISNTPEATLSGKTSVTITPANWNKPQNNTVVATGLDDGVSDGDIPYLLIAGDPTSADPSYGNLNSRDAPNARLVNHDNEPDETILGKWNDKNDKIGLKRGNEYILRTTSDGNDPRFSFGRYTDTALVGDWDDDGKDEIGLRRGNNYYLNYGNDSKPEASFNFGHSGDTVLVGDWDGDGRDTIGLRRGNGVFLNNGHDGKAETSFTFGQASDVVLIGDWDDDGKDEIGLRRGNNYYLNYGNDSKPEASFNFGHSGDTVLVGDWDGDGRDTIGLRRGNGVFLNNGHDGKAETSFTFGQASDVVLIGDWDDDGKDEIGLRRGNNYYLNYGNDSKPEASFIFGR